jgi:hypothetical protein
MPFFHCNQTSVVWFFLKDETIFMKEPGKSLILKEPVGK